MSTETERGDCAAGRERRLRQRGRWVTPVAGVLFGVAYLVVFLARHDVFMAIVGPAVMLAYVGVTTVMSGRWEAAAVLSGDTSDERRRAIDEKAAAVTLRVLAVVLVGGFFVSLARGTGANTWASMCAVVGGVYIGSTVVLTRRG